MSGKVANRREATAQLAWNIATRLERFTFFDISAEMHIDVKRAAEFVRGWVQRGAVEYVGKLGNRKSYRVIQPNMPGMPRPDGSLIRRETAPGNMWRAMRGLRVFTPTDVAAHANTPTCHVTTEAAQAYCQMLSRAQYLKVERKAVPGRREAAYRLLKNTGPVAPRERRVRAVFDENVGEYTYVQGAQ